MRASIVALLIAMLVGPTTAQRRGRLDIGLSLQQWESSDTTTFDVSQLCVPLRLDLPLSTRFGLTLKTNPGRTVLEGADDELSAVGNVVLKASWYALEQTLLLRAGVSLPTASTQLTEEELPIAVLVASDELGFSMDSPIDGPCATGGIAVAQQWGGSTLAGGLGYSIRVPYKPYEDTEDELDPGEEFVVTAGFYRRLSLADEPALLKADVAVVLYGSDLWEDAELRRLGPRTDVRGVLTTYPGEFNPLEVSLWARFRAKGDVSDGEKLVAEDDNTFGPEAALRIRAGYPLAPWVKAEVSGFIRLEGDNGYGFGGGRVIGASIGPRMRLGRSTALSISGGTLGGRAWTSNGDTDLKGYEVRTTLTRVW